MCLHFLFFFCTDNLKLHSYWCCQWRTYVGGRERSALKIKHIAKAWSGLLSVIDSLKNLALLDFKTEDGGQRRQWECYWIVWLHYCVASSAGAKVECMFRVLEVLSAIYTCSILIVRMTVKILHAVVQARMLLFKMK